MEDGTEGREGRERLVVLVGRARRLISQVRLRLGRRNVVRRALDTYGANQW